MKTGRTITLILVLLASFSTAIAQAPAKTQFCDKKIIGYITNWKVNSGVDYANLTHAFFSFLKPASDGSLLEYTSEQEMALLDFLKQTKKHGCKRFISLGGGGDEVFPEMAADSIARQRFIKNVIAFCKEKKFDGIDMDWELMDDAIKRKNYTSIMKEFRTAVNVAGLQLVSTIGFGEYWCQWIEDEALKQADWIQLMIYDQTGTWSESPFGNHASFEHYLQAEEYWVKRGITRDKIVMGLPFYGYKFSSKSGGTGTGVGYNDIVAGFPNLKPSDDQTPGEDWCFFNGPDMIYKKTLYALENGFGGVMVWEMSQDCKGEKSLHQAMVKAFQKFCSK